MTAAGRAIEDVLVREASRVLGAASPADVSLLYVNGWRMDLDAVTALVFARGAARPALVAKVAIGPARERIEIERRNLETLARGGDEAFRASVPRLIAWIEEGDTAVLLESAVRGVPVGQPRGRAEMTRLGDQAVEWLVAFHRASGGLDTTLGKDDFERLFRRPFARYLDTFQPGPTERRFLLETCLEEAEARVGKPFPLVFHHNDFCLPNLFRDGTRLEVIDWETPLIRRLPAGDLVHLFACLAYDARGAGDGGLLPFIRAFFAPGDLADAARTALGRYARATGLDAGALRLTFAAYWVDYVLEKVDARAATPGVWSLVEFGDGTCLNLAYLAENERSLKLA